MLCELEKTFKNPNILWIPIHNDFSSFECVFLKKERKELLNLLFGV